MALQTLNNPKSYDLVVRFADTNQCFYVKRDELMSKSTYFEAWLSTRWISSPANDSNSNSKSITIKDYDYETFAAYFEYLYTGQVAITDSLIESLYSLAHCYIEPSLMTLCEEYIMQRLSQDIDYFATFSPDHRFLYSLAVQINVANLYYLLRASFKFHEQCLYERCQKFGLQLINTENMSNAYKESHCYFSKELHLCYEEWTKQTAVTVENCSNLLELASEMNLIEVEYRVEFFILLQLTRASASVEKKFNVDHLQLYLKLTLKHNLISVYDELSELMYSWFWTYGANNYRNLVKPVEIWAILKQFYEIALDYSSASDRFTQMIELWVLFCLRGGVLGEDSPIHEWYSELVTYERGQMRSVFEERLLDDQRPTFLFIDLAKVCRMAHQHGRLNKCAQFRRNLKKHLLKCDFEDDTLDGQNCDVQFVLKLSVDNEMRKLELLLVGKLELDSTTLDSLYNLAQYSGSAHLKNECNNFILNKFGSNTKWNEILWLYSVATDYAELGFVTQLQNLICHDFRCRPSEWNRVVRGYEKERFNHLIRGELVQFGVISIISIQKIGQLCASAIQQLCKPLNPSSDNLVFRFVDSKRCLFANRDELASKSLYFKMKFAKRWNEFSNKSNCVMITISDYDYYTFAAYLEFLHSCSVSINDDLIESLYSLAKCYLESSLVDRCERYIEEQLRKNIDYFVTCSPKHRDLYSSSVQISVTNLRLLYHASSVFHDENLYERCEEFTLQQFDTDNIATAYLESHCHFSEKLKHGFEQWIKQTVPSMQNCANLLALAIEMNINDVVFRVELFILQQLRQHSTLHAEWIDFSYLALFLKLTLKHNLISVHDELYFYIRSMCCKDVRDQRSKVVRPPAEIWSKLRLLYEIALDYGPNHGTTFAWQRLVHDWVLNHIRSGVWREVSLVHEWYRELVTYERGTIRREFEVTLLGIERRPFLLRDIGQVCRIAYQHGRLEKSAHFRINLGQHLLQALFEPLVLGAPDDENVKLDAQDSSVEYMLKLCVDCEMTDIEIVLVHRLQIDSTTLESAYSLAQRCGSLVLSNQCDGFILNQFATSRNWHEMHKLFSLAHKYTTKAFVAKLENSIHRDLDERPNQLEPLSMHRFPGRQFGLRRLREMFSDMPT